MKERGRKRRREGKERKEFYREKYLSALLAALEKIKIVRKISSRRQLP